MTGVQTCALPIYLEELNDTLQVLEDFLKMVFGDHVKVMVTQKGVEVEEYEHD